MTKYWIHAVTSIFISSYWVYVNALLILMLQDHRKNYKMFLLKKVCFRYLKLEFHLNEICLVAGLLADIYLY